VAIRYWNDAEARADAAARQSRTTHAAKEAVDACILYADILADAIAGLPLSDVLRPRGASNRTSAVRALGEGSWRDKRRDEIASSGYVIHSLEAAIWCVARTGDFRSAVPLAANLGDDADTTAAIAGQLAAPSTGEAGFPTAGCSVSPGVTGSKTLQRAWSAPTQRRWSH
jgi:ADP-ribosyl-[dinitrogen reductase] hydrolase